MFGKRVGSRGDGHPTRYQLREQPRYQRRVARVVQLELVDAHHGVVGQQFDALQEAENACDLRQFAEARKRLRAGHRVIDRRQQVGLTDTEPAVEIDAHPGQHLPLAEQLLLARPAGSRLLGEGPARLYGRRLRRLVGIWPVGVKADRTERWGRHQLGDQPLVGDRGVPVGKVLEAQSGTGLRITHTGSVTAC